jgi:glycosyltransferase involved in cell wall biosynthesis
MDYMRWHRDAVAPLLTGNPVCLLLGAPSRRQARIVFGAQGTHAEYRVHTGRLDASTLAAAARCVDVFVLAGAPQRPYLEPDLLLAMASSGAPLVVGGGVRSSALRNEENAFIATAGDPLSLVATLNKLLALPAIQRHYLGEQFAEYTRQTVTWDAAAPIYAERFAVMVGRPQIPANLRAA